MDKLGGMMVSFDSALRVPKNVLMRELDGEAVLLNLDTEFYFGLDDVGTRMWSLLTTSESNQAAYDALLGEYVVAPNVLRHDMEELVSQLLSHGLLECKND